MDRGRARFVCSAPVPEAFPESGLPEVAFAGRSNVGKSSLLNRILGQRAMARVSKTPGRTQSLNFFDSGGGVMLVDLPGYGFARVPLSVQQRWKGLVEGYLRGREQLRGVLVLADARRGWTAEDESLVDFLGRCGAAHRVVVTKIDKLKRAEYQHLRHAMSARTDLCAFVSARSGEGVNEVREAVRALCE